MNDARPIRDTVETDFSAVDTGEVGGEIGASMVSVYPGKNFLLRRHAALGKVVVREPGRHVVGR